MDQYITILSYRFCVYKSFIDLESIMDRNALQEQQAWNDDICKIWVSIYDELDQLTFWHVFIWSLRKMKAQDAVYKVHC